MKKLAFIFVAALFLISCDSEQVDPNDACNAANPIEEVVWLKNLKESISNAGCETLLIQGVYNNTTVFFTYIADPLCNCINAPTLYNCKGEVVRIFTINDYKEFPNLVKSEKTLYRSKARSN